MAVIRYLSDFFAESLLWLWLGVFLIGTLIERLAPAERQPAGDLLLNLGYSVVLNWLIGGCGAEPVPRLYQSW